jgi:transposase
VTRGMIRRSTEGIRLVGLDEKSFGRGQDYVALMTDLPGQRVLEVVPGRDTESARALWQTLPAEQRKQVEAAAMDMGESFIAGTHLEAPQAAIVHDKYHVSALLNEAVDKTRREEHRELSAQGDDTLAKSKFLWLRGMAPEGEAREHFENLLEGKLRTARAWLHKELFVEFWSLPDRENAEVFFKKWFAHARRSQLPAIKKVALTLKSHLDGLLSFFRHRITNALTEGFNSRIQQIKADARGFRSFRNYRTRILFFCGKLSLHPQLSTPSH